MNEIRRASQSDQISVNQAFESYVSPSSLESYVSSSSKVIYEKKLSMLNKLYKKKKKFENTKDNFDFKLTIYLDKCRHADLSEHAYEKGVQLCWLMRHWFVIMRIEQILSRSMISALVCKHTLRVLSDKVIISINDTVSSLKTSLRSIRTSHWMNVFVKCDHRWILFNEIWTLHITIWLDYEKTSFESVEIIHLWFSH
jgi:hypothetical protein